MALTPRRASATTVTSGDGKLRMRYVADRTTVAAGTQVTYRYEFTNLSTDTWVFGTWNNRGSYAKLTDSGCSGAASAAPSPASGWSGTAAAGEYIAPGATAWLQCTATVTATTTSTASITGFGYAPSATGVITANTATLTATETVTVTGSARYGIDAPAVTPSTTPPGGLVTFKVTVRNTGTVTGAAYTFTAALPNAFSQYSSADGCPVSGAVITCDNQPGLAAGATRTFTFSAVAATATGSYTVNTSVYSATNNANSPATVTVANPTTSGASTDGDFTLAKTADRYTVPSGGASVTYTYTVKNTTSGRQYYYSGTDDECAAITAVSGLTRVYDVWAGRYVSYVPAGGTATFRCTDVISQTVTNTARFTFADSYAAAFYGPVTYVGASSATATATVTRQLPTGIAYDSCNELWYSSDERSTRITGNGTVGVLNRTTGAATTVFDIGVETGDATNGSAALAMDPAHPNLVYFIPRENILVGTTGKGLWVYDRKAAGAKARLVTSSVPDNGNAVTRLGAAPDGRLWTIGTSGTVYVFDPADAAAGWVNKGRMTLPANLGLAPSQLSSGDLAFDGIGTMYFITADINVGQRVSYLFTITATELADGTPAAKLAGKMGGSLGFNGLAFTDDGLAYGTETGSLHQVDVNTGAPSRVGSTNEPLVADLSSCALPKPNLRVTKTVTPDGPVTAGAELTYTITVENLGTLAATSVTLRDVPEGTTVTSARLNGGPELGAGYFATARPVNAAGNLPGVIGPGKKATVVLKVATGTGRTQVCNQAQATYEGRYGVLASDDPAQPGDADKTCTPVFTPAIAVDKTGSTDVLDSTGADTSVTYTVAVRNAGNEPLRSVDVTDPSCSPLVYLDGDTDTDGVLEGAERWTYRCTTTLTGTTNGGTGLRNTATATATGTETRTVVTGSDMFLVTPPGLTFRKSSDTNGAPVRVGDVITYTLTARNTTIDRKDLTGVVVRDVLPAGTTYVAGSASRTVAGGSTSAAHAPPNLVTGADGVTLAYGAQLTVTFQARVDVTSGAPASQLTNRAYADSDQTAEVDDYVIDRVSRPYLDVTKRPGTMTGPDPDGVYTVDYTVQVSNVGPGAVAYGTLTDTLAFDATLVPTSASWTGPTTGRVALTSPTSSFTLTGGATLAEGEDHTYTVSITFTHPGTQAVAGCGGPGTATYNSVALPAGQEVGPTSDDGACVEPVSGFALRKSAPGSDGDGIGDPAPVTVDATNGGAEVTGGYTIRVVNSGLVGAVRPPITDTITVPAGFRIVAVTVDGAPQGTTDGTFVVPASDKAVPVGASTDIVVTVTARADAPADVDWDAAGSCTPVGDGLDRGGLSNVVGAASDTDGRGNDDVCVPFEVPRAPITVRKLGTGCDVGALTCALPGGAFALYPSDPGTGSATPVPGGLTPTSGDASVFTSTPLTYFRPYWVVETTAPPGHTLLPRPVRVSLTASGLVVTDLATHDGAVAADAQAKTLQVHDPTPAVLPVTGGGGPWPVLRVGVLLVAVGTLGALGRHHRHGPRHD